MTNEEIDHVARIAAVTPVKDPLVQALSVRLVELLNESKRLEDELATILGHIPPMSEAQITHYGMDIDGLASQIYTEDVLPKVESGKDLTLHDLITRRLVQLLDAQVVVKPRVWRGEDEDSWDFPLCWVWDKGVDRWILPNESVEDGSIFVPLKGPTSPPPPVEELEAATEVDW